jgi:hypothetical protein
MYYAALEGDSLLLGSEAIVLSVWCMIRVLKVSAAISRQNYVICIQCQDGLENPEGAYFMISVVRWCNTQ